MTGLDITASAARPLGWGRFLLQLGSVVLAYVAASLPPVLIFGATSLGLVLSVALSMAAALLVAWAWLRADGALHEAWNFARPASWRRTLALGAAGALVIVVWFQIFVRLIRALGLPEPDVGMVLDRVTESGVAFGLWIVLVAWFSAGLGEELIYRGFLFDRLQRLPAIAGRFWPAATIQAVLFGVPHGNQGPAGIVMTGMVGLFLAWLRTRSAMTLWACVLAHAATDTVMMSLAFAGAKGLLPG